jgi:hypothetical protein
MTWHIPSAGEIQSVGMLLEKFLVPELASMHLVAAGTLAWTRYVPTNNKKWQVVLSLIMKAVRPINTVVLHTCVRLCVKGARGDRVCVLLTIVFPGPATCWHPCPVTTSSCKQLKLPQ